MKVAINNRYQTEGADGSLMTMRNSWFLWYDTIEECNPKGIGLIRTSSN